MDWWAKQAGRDAVLEKSKKSENKAVYLSFFNPCIHNKDIIDYY